jgi:transketolase
MRNAFINTVLDACAQREDIFIISGDAGLGVFDDFKERYPQRFLNLGVAEQNMTGFAAGLAMTGFKVVVYNIIPFILYRCYEQVRNDICYQELPVILVGIGSGVTYAPMGMSHYAVEDIGIASTLPNLQVLSPCDPVEARCAANHALAASQPVYVRLAKRGEPDLHPGKIEDIALPQVLREGEQVALLCHGSITEEVLKAHAMLVAEGCCPLLVSVPMVQPLPVEQLRDLLGGMRAVIVVEEHYRQCGLGAAVAAQLSLACPIIKLGLPERFIHEIRDTAGMRSQFGLDAGSIVQAVMQCR